MRDTCQYFYSITSAEAGGVETVPACIGTIRRNAVTLTFGGVKHAVGAFLVFDWTEGIDCWDGNEEGRNYYSDSGRHIERIQFSFRDSDASILLAEVLIWSVQWSGLGSEIERSGCISTCIVVGIEGHLIISTFYEIN